MMFPDPLDELKVDGLEIARTDFSEAVRIVSHVMGRRVSGASLFFKDGLLYIEAGQAVAKAPAYGFWPFTIIVPASWVRRLGKSMPAGDPVKLRVEEGRLYANRYSEPCVRTSVNHPLNPKVPAVDETRLILEAATALKPLRIARKDIEALVAQVRQRGPSSWRMEDRELISQVAKAWTLLAPLGVEINDIRALMDRMVRDAWKQKDRD